MPLGLRVAVFLTRAYARLLCQGLAGTFDETAIPTLIRRHFDRLDQAIDTFIDQSGLAA